ncbi:MAG TPA: hypothetical protein PKD21_12750, partial [Candidatus Competibacter phosphatis]|nr:hypothetical protein [Candidatus Competibacter phosphatis]
VICIKLNAIQGLAGSCHYIDKRVRLTRLSVIYQKNDCNSNKNAHEIDDVRQILPTVGLLEASLWTGGLENTQIRRAFP